MADVWAKYLQGVPEALRTPLVSEFETIEQRLLLADWREATMAAGRFAEVAWAVVEGHVHGAFSPAVQKPKDFVGACRKLESTSPISIGDRSARIAIPRLLPFVYELRNNRDVGHVGGDVDANRIDAEAAATVCAWVLGEFVRIFHRVSVDDAAVLVGKLVERRTPLVWSHGSVRRVMAPSMNAGEQVLVLLAHDRGAVETANLQTWCKYSNKTQFRAKVLGRLDRQLFIDFDSKQDLSIITPLGVEEARRLIATH